MPRAPKFSSLKVHELSLQVRLGCLPEERATRQEVRVGVELRFSELPKGVVTDELIDTACYAEISNAIRNHCESGEFKLIERMGHEVYYLVQKIVSEKVEIGIFIHKINPPVESVLGGTSFHCGDFSG